MQTSETAGNNKIHRAISNIVVAEIFLVQASIESANAIGSGLSDLGKQFYWSDEQSPPVEPIKSVLARTRDEVVQSYASRFNFFRI